MKMIAIISVSIQSFLNTFVIDYCRFAIYHAATNSILNSFPIKIPQHAAIRSLHFSKWMKSSVSQTLKSNSQQCRMPCRLALIAPKITPNLVFFRSDSFPIGIFPIVATPSATTMALLYYYPFKIVMSEMFPGYLSHIHTISYHG